MCGSRLLFERIRTNYHKNQNNNIISAAHKIESEFQETCVTKMASVFIIDEDTTTTMGTTKYRCNATASTSSETVLMFLEGLITKMVDKQLFRVEIHKIPTVFEVYNIPIDIWRVPFQLLWRHTTFQLLWR